MMPARQECSEGCWGGQPGLPHSPEPAQHPKYSMESISLPAHWVTTAAMGLSSSPEVSQGGFMRLLCRKHVLKRERLAEAEDGAIPSGRALQASTRLESTDALLGTALQRWSRDEVQAPLSLSQWAL